MVSRCKWILYGAVLILAVGLSSLVYADNTIINGITDQYANNMQSWHGPLVGIAQRVFWLLVLIDVVLTIGKLMLKKADFSDWAEEFIKHILIIGAFYAFLIHSADWAFAIIQSFRMAGNTASGAAGGIQGLQPVDVFNAGITMCTTLLQSLTASFELGKLVESLALVLGSFIILISLCLIAALEIVALLESYIFMYAGVLFLGFGGSQITADIAKRYFMGLLSVGAKLFAIQLIIGLGLQTLQQWADMVVVSNGMLDLQVIAQIVGGSVIMLCLAQMVPQFAQGMVSGSSMSSIHALISSAAAVGSVGAAMGLGSAAALTAPFNPGAAARLANQASGQATEAFRHTTGHSTLNPLHGLGKDRNQGQSEYTGTRPFRGDSGQGAQRPPQNGSSSPSGNGTGNVISN